MRSVLAAVAGVAAGKGALWGMGAWTAGYVAITAARNWRLLMGWWL